MEQGHGLDEVSVRSNIRLYPRKSKHFILQTGLLNVIIFMLFFIESYFHLKTG